MQRDAKYKLGYMVTTVFHDTQPIDIGKDNPGIREITNKLPDKLLIASLVSEVTGMSMSEVCRGGVSVVSRSEAYDGERLLHRDCVIVFSDRFQIVWEHEKYTAAA